MGATATEKDGITTIVFPLTKTFNIRNLVNPDGSQSIMIDTYDRKTVSVAPAANAQPVVSTPPMLIISAVTEIKNVRESNEGLAAMKKDIYNMSRDAKGNPEFTDALIAIGKMEYNTAYDILIAASVKNPKIKAIVAQYNRDNVSQLQAINTYTYGARSSMDVKNQVAVLAKEYNAMRSLNGVEPAEKKLGVYNIDAEKFFQSTA